MSQAGIINVASQTGVVDSVTGTNGVTASPTTGNVVVSGVNATTSSVGVASYNPAQFTVNPAGQVSLLTQVQTVQITVTSAQLKTLLESPVQLIPAAGANTVVTILSFAAKYAYGGTNPFTGGQNITVNYVNKSGVNALSVVNIFTGSNMNGTASLFTAQTAASPTSQTVGKIDNQGIFLCLGSGSSDMAGNAAGDNSIIIFISYIISIL